MITESKNKVMEPQKTKIENLEEFSFPGSGQYEPITIKAKDIIEATKIWEKEKKLITNKE